MVLHNGAAQRGRVAHVHRTREGIEEQEFDRWVEKSGTNAETGRRLGPGPVAAGSLRGHDARSPSTVRRVGGPQHREVDRGVNESVERIERSRSRLLAAVRGLLSTGVFALVAGLGVGVLVAALLIPVVQDADVTTLARAQRDDGARNQAATRGAGPTGGGRTDGSAGAGDAVPAELEGPAASDQEPAGGPPAGGTGPSGEGVSGARGGSERSGGGGSGDASSNAVRGVSDERIKIGVALPDIEDFGAVSEEFDIGDAKEQMEAILDGWRREGRLPVHGRDIQFIYREFSILNSDEKIAACNGFIKDDEVFAVIAGRFFGEGAECVTARFETPLVTLNSTLESTYQRGAPFYFTVRPSWERLFGNWVAWADRNGHFEGRTIGLFYEEEIDPAIEEGIRNEMEARGYTIEEEVAASGSGIGSSQDQVAVQQFRQNGVDLAVLVVGGTSAINFMNFAEQQGYRPEYLGMDYGEHTTDAAASAFPPEQYDGTFAMSATRIGEIAAGFPLPEETRHCVSNYERFSGEEIGHESPESAEYNNILMSCDLAEPMLAGISDAGRDLTFLGLVSGLEAIDGQPLAGHGDLGFEAGRHDGVTSGRSIQWTAECECWHAADRDFTGFSS